MTRLEYRVESPSVTRVTAECCAQRGSVGGRQGEPERALTPPLAQSPDRHVARHPASEPSACASAGSFSSKGAGYPGVFEHGHRHSSVDPEPIPESGRKVRNRKVAQARVATFRAAAVDQE